MSVPLKNIVDIKPEVRWGSIHGGAHGVGTGNPRKYVDVAEICIRVVHFGERGRASRLRPPRAPPFDEIAYSRWILRRRT